MIFDHCFIWTEGGRWTGKLRMDHWPSREQMIDRSDSLIKSVMLRNRNEQIDLISFWMTHLNQLGWINSIRFCRYGHNYINTLNIDIFYYLFKRIVVSILKFGLMWKRKWPLSCNHFSLLIALSSSDHLFSL